MKALIFNSGIGKRMGELTKNSPKSMVKLLNGETVFERQIRILQECGIKEFVITTGPFEEQLIAITKKAAYKDLDFHFVHNDLYAETNYIYSAYLARYLLDDDFLTLHGDLVFNKKLVQSLINYPAKSVALINEKLPLPEKDFKGRVFDGKLKEVGVNIFDEDCYALQPLYKLSNGDVIKWINSIIDFVENKDITGVYAENAFNVISDIMDITTMSYDGYFIDEIDNPEDYDRVAKEIQKFDYREQEIYYGLDNLQAILAEKNIKKPLVVLDSFLKKSWATEELEKYCKPVYFSEFQPNPLYEDVVEGIKLIKNEQCDGIISIGGGSAIDTAKAIKMFLPLDENKNYLKQEFVYCNINHIAIPTTAGTGSESTRYAVIYFDNVKQSLTNDSLIPNVVILDTKFLKTLPLKQKVSTVLDALCQGIESMWSVNSTDESKDYARSSIRIILANIDSYIEGEESVLAEIVYASNLAGKAINITQTTAAHALSYKITSVYKIPHGQAVAICLPYVWEKLVAGYTETIDLRGAEYLKNILEEINDLFCCDSSEKSIETFKKLLANLNAKVCVEYSEDDLNNLVSSVNNTRLKNFPLNLSESDIKEVYINALGGCDQNEC